MNVGERIAMINFKQAMDCLEVVMQRHLEKHGEAPPFVVVVGGTAMAAHGVRLLSTDVDYYSPKIDEDIVYAVEAEMKANFGRKFKIDATPGENIWGPILFRDINDAVQITEISLGSLKVPVKALSPYDLVLVKLAADRAKDRDDLPLLAPQVEPGALIERFNTVIAWHSDRGATMAYTDRFLDFIEKHLNVDAIATIDDLSIPEYVKEMVREARSDNDLMDGNDGP